MRSSLLILSAGVLAAVALNTGASSAATADDSLPSQTAVLQQARSVDDSLNVLRMPLGPDEAEFSRNRALSPDEVTARNLAIGDSYDVGEPPSLEDLEFMHIYASGAPELQEPGQTPKSQKALVDTTRSFSRTSAQAGTQASVAGSARIVIGSTVSNSWNASWTAKRVSGSALTKIKSRADVYAYGAVAAWPYIGLVYQAHPSASLAGQSFYFSRTANFTAFVAYMTVDCTSTFRNAIGSFQITAF